MNGLTLFNILYTTQHLEAVIKSRIPSILAMINKSIDEIEAELNQIGRPLANDAGVRKGRFQQSFFEYSVYSPNMLNALVYYLTSHKN